MAFLSNLDNAGQFAAKMRALTNMEMPEEKLMRSIRRVRGEDELAQGARTLGTRNAKELLVAEIKGLASDIPQAELQKNPFLRSALFEVENEKAARLSYEELEDTKRMIESVRRNLGFVATSPPKE